MGMYVLFVLFVLQCLVGFVLFIRARLDARAGTLREKRRVSVIIPARNEEGNLPHLLDSIRSQTYQPQEVIVVDDCSSDRTGEIAAGYGAKVIRNTELPDHWTGKNWALWNGFLQSTGDILVFFDADVRLAPRALERLLAAREKCGGAVSVVPYHYMERPYEKLSLVAYLLGVFAFTSPFESKNAKKGLYGSCIVVDRKNYEKVNGHQSVSGEVLDDLNLGRRLTEAGIPIENDIGGELVSFRMYPGGIASELQGFGKGAVISTSCLMPATVLLIAVWLVGLFATGFGVPVLLLAGRAWAWPFAAGYLLYALQILYFTKYTGGYGLAAPILHFVSSLFFVVIMLYSVYQVVFVGSVTWKGRQINVKGRRGA
jgi:glycosyltransferase involved in cell wall biosynthesis